MQFLRALINSIGEPITNIPKDHWLKASILFPIKALTSVVKFTWKIKTDILWNFSFIDSSNLPGMKLWNRESWSSKLRTLKSIWNLWKISSRLLMNYRNQTIIPKDLENLRKIAILNNIELDSYGHESAKLHTR